MSLKSEKKIIKNQWKVASLYGWFIKISHAIGFHLEHENIVKNFAARYIMVI